MKKVIVKTGGDSIGIRFNKQERKIYGINEGDVMDLSDMTLHKLANENLSDILAKQNQSKVIKAIKDKLE
jgi:hypothetical protein